MVDERKKRAGIKKRKHPKHRFKATRRGRCAACLSWYLVEQEDECPLCGCASVSETKKAK